jgi:hypothetical protein
MACSPGPMKAVWGDSGRPPYSLSRHRTPARQCPARQGRTGLPVRWPSGWQSLERGASADSLPRRRSRRPRCGMGTPSWGVRQRDDASAHGLPSTPVAESRDRPAGSSRRRRAGAGGFTAVASRHDASPEHMRAPTGHHPRAGDDRAVDRLPGRPDALEPRRFPRQAARRYDDMYYPARTRRPAQLDAILSAATNGAPASRSPAYAKGRT